MSVRRLLGTALGMAAIAGLLAALTPPVPATLSALATAQRTADASGADVLVLHAVGLLAWLVWGWGALGLALTALSALPGLLGSIARAVLHRVLPRGARSAAALALGLGLGIASPLLGAGVPVFTATPAAAAADELPAGAYPAGAGAVPDWPAVPAAPTPPTTAATGPSAPPAASGLPDWPVAPAAGEHVVVRGDCLWRIAETRLVADAGHSPSTAEVAAAVHAWWQANADVIGPDPDRLLPGQVLRPPVLP
jgi:nucleoid-associated protein YgaU